MDLGCAYVDCEWDSIAALAARRRAATQLIASRHWNDKAGAPVYSVIGYDNDPARRKQAEQLQAVDQTSDHLIAVAQQAQVLMIATPVLAVRQVLAEIASHLRSETIITDTASTNVVLLR